MSNIVAECKKFHFLGPSVKHDGFWDLLLAICQLWYPLFRLLRLADMRGGIDKVKYYVCQVDLPKESGLQNVLKKWSAPTCPEDKILSASMRKLDNSKVGNLKTEGLDSEGDNGNGKLVSLVLLRIFNVWDITNIIIYQTQAQIQIHRKILPLNKRRNQMKIVRQRKSHLTMWES